LQKRANANRVGILNPIRIVQSPCVTVRLVNHLKGVVCPAKP
jgi:hypothetical protein